MKKNLTNDFLKIIKSFYFDFISDWISNLTRVNSSDYGLLLVAFVVWCQRKRLNIVYLAEVRDIHDVENLNFLFWKFWISSKFYCHNFNGCLACTWQELRVHFSQYCPEVPSIWYTYQIVNPEYISWDLVWAETSWDSYHHGAKQQPRSKH